MLIKLISEPIKLLQVSQLGYQKGIGKVEENFLTG